MFTRISTASTFTGSIAAYLSKESDLAKVQQQISSNNKYTNFAEIAKDGQIRRVSDFNSALDQINTYKRNNTILTSRLNTVDNVLSAIEDINTKAIAAITQERSAVQKDNPLTQEMKAFLDQIQGQLNTNVDGRYLFAGAATGTPPVAALSGTSNLDPATQTPTDNYYKGDNTNLSQAVSVDVTIQYNVKANDPAFQKLIGAFNLAIKAEANNDDTALSSAIDIANSAQQDLANMRSAVDANAAIIEQVNNQHDDFQTYYKNSLDGITGTDVAAASISLSLDQAVLTASFQAFARISSLTLSSYLSHA